MIELICPVCKANLKDVGIRIPISGYSIGTYIDYLPREYPNGVFDAGEIAIMRDDSIQCGECGIDVSFYLKDMEVNVME